MKLFYIHGLTSNKDTNSILKNACLLKGYEFYSINLPGHGNLEFNDDISIEGFAKYVKQYMIENNIIGDIVIYGHSLGGSIAGYLAAKYSHILGIKKVILEDPLNKTIRHEIKNINIDEIQQRIENIKVFKKDHKSKEHHMFEWYQKLRTRIPINKAHDYLKLIKNIMNKKTLERTDVYYTECKVPFTLIFGANDFIIPPEESIEYFKKIHPDMSSYVISNASHSPYKENPEEYKIILDKIL